MYYGHAHNAPRSHPVLRKLRELPRLHGGDSVAERCYSVPLLRFREGYVFGEGESLSLLRRPSETEILPQGRHDFRGLSYPAGKVAPCCVALGELQEWNQQLRNSPRSWRNTEECMVHVAKDSARRSNKVLPKTRWKRE